MEYKPSLTRSQAVEQVLTQVDGPISIDEFSQRVLAIWPSKAKNPLSSMRSYLRLEQAGRTLVFVDAQTILPLPIALCGVRFRIPLSRQEVKRGVLIIHPAFDYFSHRELEPVEAQLLDQKGCPLPAHPVIIRAEADTPSGRHTIERDAFDLGDWFRAQRARRNDSILVTIEDWESSCFRLEHESSRRRRKKEIERRDRELADLLFGMLEAARHEMIYGYQAIPTAYARLSDPQGYPGSHWVQVIGRDKRMMYDGWAIRYSDWRSPLESMFYAQETLPQAAFSPAQGRQVYRFKAALWHRSGLWRRVEIQGQQTLADLDSVLRDAFEHDPGDHLGGFWKRIRRGKGKRFGEIDVGDVDPFGEGSGAEVHVAGLGLESGHELKYVYDFGDWIEHRLTLEEIVEPEANAEYPRIIAQNRPRYRYCQSCRDQGRKARATWICLECSNEQQREILLCEDCLDKDHEDHFAEEILY
jgi:hypothetical protein